MPDEPRTPNSLQGLLQFCMSAGTNPSNNMTEVDEERRSWLNEALNSMTVDVVGRMRDLIRSILNYVLAFDTDGADASNAPEAEKAALEALEELIDLTEDVNFSMDFMKIGGFDLIPALLNSDKAFSAQVRAATASLLAAIVQNNPPCQDFLVAHFEHVVVQLLKIIDQPAEPEIVRVKALSGISCSVRHHRPALELFARHDGFAVLMRALQAGEEAVKTKVAFLITSLLSETGDFDDALLAMGLVAHGADLLKEPHRAWHEHLILSLLTISRRCAAARSACSSGPDLHASLTRRIGDLRGGEEHEETLQYAGALCEELGWPCTEADIPVLR